MRDRIVHDPAATIIVPVAVSVVRDEMSLLLKDPLVVVICPFVVGRFSTAMIVAFLLDAFPNCSHGSVRICVQFDVIVHAVKYVLYKENHT